MKSSKNSFKIPKKILIIGLPGSGKTTLAKILKKDLDANWINADKIRKKFNDWDFSKKGVLRQAKRMGSLASKSKNKFTIADFVCPYEKGRKIFKPDFLIWMNTIKKGRLPTFDKSFEKPKKFDYLIKEKREFNLHSIKIQNRIKKFKWENKKRITTKLIGYKGGFKIELAPNITEVNYGRTVGYKIKKIKLEKKLKIYQPLKLEKS